MPHAVCWTVNSFDRIPSHAIKSEDLCEHIFRLYTVGLELLLRFGYCTDWIDCTNTRRNCTFRINNASRVPARAWIKHGVRNPYFLIKVKLVSVYTMCSIYIYMHRYRESTVPIIIDELENVIYDRASDYDV